MSKPDLVLRLEAPKEFLEAFLSDEGFGKLEQLMHDSLFHEILDIYSDWLGRPLASGFGHTGTELEEGHYIECDWRQTEPAEEGPSE